MSRTYHTVSRSRRISAVAAAVLLTASFSAVGQQEHAAGAEPRDPSGSQPGSTGVGAGDLEALREVVIRYYREEGGDRYAPRIEELTRGAVFLAGELFPGSPPAIGSWRLEEIEGRTALVRQPPVPTEFPTVMPYLGVYLDREGEGWRVTGEYLLEERVDRIEAVVEDSDERPLGQGDCTGRGGASIRVAGEDLFLPLDELRLIQREVVRFLADEDPELEPSVFGPGEAFVDCRGVARMGAWILESGHAPNELRLAFRIHTSEIVIVRQIIALERRGEVWRATGVSRQIAHLRQ